MKTLLALAASVFSYALMQTTVVPAVGLLQRELDTTPGWASWIISGFLLSSAVLTPLFGRMGDLYGKRRVLLAVLITYFAGMAGAVAAQDIGQLIAARIVQGVALAAVPLSMAILRETMPRERMAFAFGLISGIVGVGAGVGLVVGGLLADHLSWRWLFGLGALLTLVSLVLVVRFVPESTHTAKGRLDLPGAVLLGAGLVSLLLALTQRQAWLGMAAVLFFVVLVLVERRKDDALIDLAELTDRPMLATHALAFLFGASSYFLYLGLPAYAQLEPGTSGVGFGATVTVSGLLMLPGTLILLPAGTAVGKLAERFGPRWPAVLGFAIAALGSVLLSLAHASVWEHLVFYTVVGAGSGLVMATLPKLIGDLVPLTRTGVANGLNNLARTVGGVVGSGLAAAVLSGGYTDAAFTTLFWLAAGTGVLGLAVAPFAVRHAGGREHERVQQARA
ncbi:MFS transporter [Sinosporangium siamense]|uniref:MFS transporter n=1 Tax=Sinosporangium siamense TaxID=1367973 RepID=A0A919V8E4_9ACTN|nr:MFS transporter [Sinosporangium siamense]GII94126.1 MFS transporter [Sinosporangium siamense]